MHYPTENLSPGIIALIVVVGVWTAIWKGIALWQAGRRADLAWFVVMLILNTAGILEIIYIFAVARRKPVTPPAPPAG